MTPPFSTDEFFGVFIAYNQAVWPMQVVLVGLALAVVWMAYRRSNRSGALVAIVLAALWAWMGIAYHWAFFADINPAARVFGALFVLEAGLLAWFGMRVPSPVFRPKSDVFGWVGGLLVAYALVVYPVLGIAMGHTYPAQPTFGLPCPTTIFTLGVLLWARPKVSWVVLWVPLLWTVVGTSAVRSFGVLEDAVLPLAGITVALLTARKNRGVVDAT